MIGGAFLTIIPIKNMQDLYDSKPTFRNPHFIAIAFGKIENYQ
jgi:hypothetical protein